MTKPNLKRYFGYTVTSVIPSVFAFPEGDGISGADCMYFGKENPTTYGW